MKVREMQKIVFNCGIVLPFRSLGIFKIFQCFFACFKAAAVHTEVFTLSEF